MRAILLPETPDLPVLAPMLCPPLAPALRATATALEAAREALALSADLEKPEEINGRMEWPVMRHAMRSPRALRVRLAEDILRFLREGRPTIGIDDLLLLGWRRDPRHGGRLDGLAESQRAHALGLALSQHAADTAEAG